MFKDWWNRPTLARLFDIVFFLISAATFRHTADGFASIEGSTVPGWFAAIAIDATMYLAALALGSELNRREKFATGLLLLATAGASTVSQWQFSITHARVLEIAPAAQWWGISQKILDWRIVWMPFSLPLFALLVSVVGRAQDGRTVTLEQYDRVVASKTELESELDDREPQLEQMRTEAQSQQGVVKDLQGQLVSLSHELAAAEGWLKLTGKMRAQIVASMNGDGTLSNKEIAKLAGTSASNASRAVKEQAERF